MSTLVSKTLDDIRTELFGRIEAVQDTYVAKGWLPIRLNLNRGVIRGLIELWAWGLYQLYAFLAALLERDAFPTTAEDDWLETHCEQVEVKKKSATKAGGVVVFYREESSGNVSIPSGRIVRTKVDGTGNIYRFVTTESSVLPDGDTEVEVPVIAEAYGAASNVSEGQICEIVTAITGIDGVENQSDWLTSEGADQERDDELQDRYALKWQSVSGYTKYAYKRLALEVAGVATVEVLDQHPRGQGTVDVIITGTAGAPTQTLIDTVAAAIAAEAHQNDDVEVRGPDEVPVPIGAELVLTEGDADEIIADAESRIRALFGEKTVDGVTALVIGQDVTLDLLRAVLMAVDGVKKINWTSPTDDVSVAEDELAGLESCTITTTEASEA